MDATTNDNGFKIPIPTQKPFTPGANSPNSSAFLSQQNQNKLQNQLGAGRRKKKLRGGAQNSIQVPAPPSYSPNPAATQNNFTQLTTATVNLQAQSAMDSLAQPPKSGGSKSSYKRGGYWPKWGCLSGGKKSNKKRNKRKTKKTRKSRKSKRHH